MPETYFNLTPRLVTVVVDGRARQRETEFEQLAWAVHQNAALCLSEPRKFPSFTKFMKPVKPRKAAPSTPEYMLSVARLWTAAINRRDDHEG